VINFFKKGYFFRTSKFKFYFLAVFVLAVFMFFLFQNALAVSCADHHCISSVTLADATDVVLGTTQDVKQNTPDIIPNLEVQIPGFNGFSKDIQICLETGKSLDQCQENQKGFSIPWIGEYIIAVYKWAVRAIAILAVIVIMWGGFQWVLARGNSSAITEAKSKISSALMGIVIIVGMNVFLSAINPNLTILKPITLGQVQKISLEAQGYVNDTELAPNSIGCAQEQDLAAINDSPYIVFTSNQSMPELRKETAVKLKLAAQQLYQTKGVKLQVNNAYRTLDQQISLCETAKAKKLSSCPYQKPCSEVTCNDCPHTLGYGVDVVCAGKGSSENNTCGLTAIMKQVGFCQLKSESWHFEYPKMSSSCN
jgi:hypothetical protein